MLLSAFLSNGVFNQKSEFFNVIRSEIGKVRPFGMTPHLFNRVKFRRVAGKPLNRDIFVPTELPEEFSLVNAPSVHDKYDILSNASPDTFEETDNIFGSNVVLENTKEKLEMASFRRYADRADNRETVVSLLLVEDRGLSFRRPGASGKWLKHKSALIDENNRFISFLSVFLYAASVPSAIVALPLDSAPVPDVAVSGNSSPKNAISSRHVQDGRLCRSVPELAWLSLGVSRVGPHNQKRLDLEEVVLEASAFALKTGEKVCGGEVLLLMLSCRPFSHFASSDVLKKLTNVLLLQPRGDLIPSLTTLLLGVFELPTPLVFLLASYFILYFGSFRNASINRSLKEVKHAR